MSEHQFWAILGAGFTGLTIIITIMGMILNRIDKDNTRYNSLASKSDLKENCANHIKTIDDRMESVNNTIDNHGLSIEHQYSMINNLQITSAEHGKDISYLKKKAELS